jgi:hypothetical protein
MTREIFKTFGLQFFVNWCNYVISRVFICRDKSKKYNFTNGIATSPILIPGKFMGESSR